MAVFLKKYGEQATIQFPIIKRAVVDFAVSADWTPAGADIALSKDAGNFADATNTAAITGGSPTRGSAFFKLVLTGTELQAAEVAGQVIDAATKAVEDQAFTVYTYGHPSAKFPFDNDRYQAPYPAEITATQFGSDATSHAVSMPTTVEQGDLLIVLFCNDGNATVTTPTGWTSLSSDADSGNAVRLSCYAKKADGTEGGTTVDFVTSATEQAAAQVYRFQKGTWYGDASNSFANSIKAGSAANGSSTSPNPPSVTPPWKRINSLFISVEGHDDGTSTTTAYSSNYVDHTTTASASSASGSYLSSCIRSQATTAEDPGTFTITSQEWVAQTICIRAAQPVAYADSVNLTYLLGTAVSSPATAGVLDVNVKNVNNDSTAASREALFWGKVRLITVDNATFSPTTTEFETDQTTDDAARYSEQVLYALDGNNVAYTVRITGYAFTNSKVKLTVDTLPVAPSNGHRFLLMGRIEQ